MLQFSTKKAVLVLKGVVLIAFILLTASCSGPARPTIEQPPSNSSTEQTTDTPASVRKISVGQQLRFDTISLEQGLSQSTVFCILQDSQGFLWFGTEDGLNKYDGYNFTVYKPDPEDPNSLGVRWIQYLFEDDAGTLWIGTNGGGLSRYDRALDHFNNFRNDPGDPGGLSGDDVTAIFQDPEGVLWIGTDGGGLDRFDRESERFVHYQHDPEDPNSLSSNAVSTIYGDQDGVLWIGTGDGGLNRFDPKNEHWQHFGNDPGYPDNLTHKTITVISEDQSGMLWVGTIGGGLIRYDRDNEQFNHYHHDPDDPGSLSSDEVAAIYHDQDGVLWIGTYGAGLNRFDPGRETFAHYQNIPGDPHSLSQDTILSIYQDREGVLWFGTIGGGVNKLNNGWRNFTLYQNNPQDPNSLGDNMVRAFYQDVDNAGDNLWIGSMFGGLDRFDRRTGTWHHYRHDPNDPGSLSNDFVSTIYRDRSGELWIGTTSGLDRFNPGSQAFTRYQSDPDAPPGSPANNVRTIYEFKAGKFWIGTKGGLFQFDPQDGSWSQTFHHDPNTLVEDWIFSFLQDREGMIWIGTVGSGFYKFDPEKERFTHYQNDPDDPNSLGGSVIISPITQDRSGTLWIGNLNGLDRFDPQTETFTHYRTKDGLPNETVYCIVEDRFGYLWVSTNGGLSRYDPGSDTFRNYDVTDGLQSNEFNSNACLVNEGGEMFFGGIDGFNVFTPGQIIDNLTVPPVVITRFTHRNEQVNLGQAGEGLMDVSLKWPDNAFEFEFAALSYTRPEENQYAYYLEGFEKGWNEVGTRRFGGYTNLPGGAYTLHVKGTNNDGVWNETGTSLKITIVPPFWATWWFRGTAALLLVGAAFLGYQLRIRNVEKRSQNLEIQVEERTAELQREIAQRTQVEEALRNSEMEKAITEERSRLARELHDSVTQSLYSLTLFTEAARHVAEEDGNKEIEQYIGQIGTIGLHALKEMRLLVFELRPSELEKEGLVRALRRRMEAVEGRAGVDARVVVDDLVKLPGIVEQEFFRIAQEALNNALKHAAASSVVVNLHRENGGIVMEIVDDGVGFDPQSLPDRGGMGLKNIRERAAGLGGEVDIVSNPGDGTRIKVIIGDVEDVQPQGEPYE